MTKIPTYKISEVFEGEIASVKYISDDNYIPPVEYAHRDDYYIFLLMEKGECIVIIDFEEYKITEHTVHYILPGQVHFPVNRLNAGGWRLAVDSMLVKDEYKAVFERASLSKKDVRLRDEDVSELRHCISAIEKRLKPGRLHIEDSVVRDLLICYIGMIAEIYLKESSISENNRAATITFQFKSLLSANYQTMKRPSQYASLMNLSPAYLNETVKKATGLNVSECIQNEISIQAKRLLYHSDLSIKEIAVKLGYEDWAYFTRLFTKAFKLSPTEFRKKYRK